MDDSQKIMAIIGYSILAGMTVYFYIHRKYYLVMTWKSSSNYIIKGMQRFLFVQRKTPRTEQQWNYGNVVWNSSIKSFYCVHRRSVVVHDTQHIWKSYNNRLKYTAFNQKNTFTNFIALYILFLPVNVCTLSEDILQRLRNRMVEKGFEN